jgi:hypothetical protein
MRQPLVTIVTPSFNQGRFIRQTIESVLEQDYPRIEYIIMDGGSTDETADVVGDYAGRLCWISEHDEGQSHAINKGFRRAHGELVAWLNSDDLLLPGAVRHAVAAFEGSPQLGAVYGEGYLIDQNGAIKQRFPHTQEMNLWRLVHLSDFILQQSVFFRKDVLAEVGYINQQLHYTMDWDVLIRIAKRYPLKYIREFMAALREHPEAKSSSGGVKRVREIRDMLRVHTGMRIPPGYIVYGLDTYQGIWCDWVAQHAPARFREPLVRTIRTACSTYIGRTILEAQGWYPDGWAGPTVRWMSPPGEGTLAILGRLPDMGGPLDGQVLEVRENGHVLGRQPLEAGPFQLEIEPRGSRHEVVNLTLHASRFVIPEPMMGGPDRRRISYYLDEIRRI